MAMKLIAMATLTLAATTSIAAAQTLSTEPVDDRDVTKLSGTAGTERLAMFAGERGVMRGIEWSEQQDDPCWLRIVGVQYVGGEKREVSRLYKEGCDKPEYGMKVVALSGADATSTRLIRGIQVCTNKSGLTMKGLRIWPIRLDLETGKLSDDGSPPVARERNRCKTWHAKRFCPSGQVATGVVLQTRGRTIKGAGLQCSKVRVSKKMTRPGN
jgi:hypothetical protein